MNRRQLLSGICAVPIADALEIQRDGIKGRKLPDFVQGEDYIVLPCAGTWQIEAVWTQAVEPEEEGGEAMPWENRHESTTITVDRPFRYDASVGEVLLGGSIKLAAVRVKA